MATNSIVERIRKLLAHEKSARAIGSIAEAEAFAAKIQALLDEHKLGMTDVEFSEREKGEPIGWQHVGSEDAQEGFRYSRKRSHWQFKMAQVIAECNTCDMVLSDGNSVCFVGRTSDRELCKILFLYMLDLAYHLNDLCAEREKDEQRAAYHDTLEYYAPATAAGFRLWMKQFRKSWFVGFSQAVCARMMVQHSAMKKAAQANTSAMIHIGRDIMLIEKEVKSKTKTTPVYNRGPVRNDTGFEHGKRTGQAINLSPNRFQGATGRTSRLLGA